MPELPEVEVVRRQLESKILNKKIIGINSYYSPVFNGDLNDLILAVKNASIIRVERYGKYLVFIFDNQNVVISHLRMEGKYHYQSSDIKIKKHEHIAFLFADNTALIYEDTRKFGRMDLRTIDNYLSVDPLKKLGNEPFNMVENELFNKIHKKSTPIKVALLDQTIIAGLGNIYVDETLFLSKIHPLRLANSISKDEANFITLNAKKVLDKALLLGGTTIRSFSALDMHGKFQNELLVHTKKGEPCPICQTPIIKIKVGGRGTYVCPNCQK